jgi:succinate dehydrogenase / fumarate reductase iron-sulfur subunit
MSAQAAEEGFGHCTSIGECAAACPAGIQLEAIARMNGDFIRAALSRRDESEPLAAVPRASRMRKAMADPSQKVE